MRLCCELILATSKASLASETLLRFGSCSGSGALDFFDSAAAAPPLPMPLLDCCELVIISVVRFLPTSLGGYFLLPFCGAAVATAIGSPFSSSLSATRRLLAGLRPFGRTISSSSSALSLFISTSMSAFLTSWFRFVFFLEADGYGVCFGELLDFFSATCDVDASLFLEGVLS